MSIDNLELKIQGRRELELRKITSETSGSKLDQQRLIDQLRRVFNRVNHAKLEALKIQRRAS